MRGRVAPVAPPSCVGPPSSHARFPWAPALLCAACLGMSAWTWMRYSYCWDISVRDLPRAPEGVHLGLAPHLVKADARPSREASLRAVWPGAVADDRMRHRYVRSKGRVLSVPVPCLSIGLGGAREVSIETVDVSDGVGAPLRILVPPARVSPYRVGEDVAFRGRLVLSEFWWVGVAGIAPLSLDTSAGRWHPASVGGLAVGTMGALVFALYLRGWLRGRRSTPATTAPYSRAAGRGPR